MPQERVELPWDITATFTLDGPTVSASKISGASGVVGIRIDLKSERPEETADLTPISRSPFPTASAMTRPQTKACLCLPAIRRHWVAAVGKPGEDLTIHTYVTAKNFTMSSLSVAAVACDSERTGCYGNLTSLTDRASTLVDGLTNVGSQRNHELIAQLEQLRDHEKELAETTIAQREQEHEQAFNGISTRTSARIRRIFPDRLAIPRNLPPFSAPRPN